MISGSLDKTLKLWDDEKGELLHNLVGHTKAVTIAMVLANDGKRVILGYDDKSIKVWDIKSGICKITLYLLDMINCLTISTDTQTVIAGDCGGNIVFYEIGRDLEKRAYFLF